MHTLRIHPFVKISPRNTSRLHCAVANMYVDRMWNNFTEFFPVVVCIGNQGISSDQDNFPMYNQIGGEAWDLDNKVEPGSLMRYDGLFYQKGQESVTVCSKYNMEWNIKVIKGCTEIAATFKMM